VSTEIRNSPYPDITELRYAGFIWKEHIKANHRYYNPTKVGVLRMDPNGSGTPLGWIACVDCPTLVRVWAKHAIVGTPESLILRILLLTTYYKPDVAATGVIMSQIAERLVAMGHRVTVLTTMPHYDRNRIWDEYRWKLIKKERDRGLSIWRLYIYVPEAKNSNLGRFLSYFSFNVLSILSGFFCRKHDLILVPSPPLTNGITADLLSRFYRIPFIYNVQDIWPDVVIRAGVLTNSTLIAFFRRMEGYIYKRASEITVLSRQMKGALTAKGVPAEKLHIIPTCQDPDFVRPLPRQNDFSASQQINEKFVVLFAGNVGHSQGLDTVLESARLLEDKSDILFLIIGNGVAKSSLEDYARKLNLSNVRFLPYQPHARIPEIYASADVCLVPLKRGFTTESVPSKVHTIMAAARPIIASVDPGSATSELIEKAECGLCVELGNPTVLAEAILKLHDDPLLTSVLARNGRRYVKRYFTPEIVASQYHDLLRRVVE